MTSPEKYAISKFTNLFVLSTASVFGVINSSPSHTLGYTITSSSNTYEKIAELLFDIQLYLPLANSATIVQVFSFLVSSCVYSFHIHYLFLWLPIPSTFLNLLFSNFLWVETSQHYSRTTFHNSQNYALTWICSSSVRTESWCTCSWPLCGVTFNLTDTWPVSIVTICTAKFPSWCGWMSL